MRTQRPYQADCISATRAALLEVQSVLVVLPTGAGKSVIFSELTRTMGRRTLVLANRGELIFQAARHIERAGLEVSIEKAELHSGTNLFNRTPVVVASVQTMVSKNGDKLRMHKWKPTDFGLIVCDEADLFCAPTFRKILDYFKSGNPDLKIFGCTASPSRSDEKALRMVFERCAFKYGIMDAINDGWLVPVKALSLRVEDMDLSHIPTTAGDLNSAALAKVMEGEKPLYGVAQAALEAAFYLEPNVLHGVHVSQWSKFLIDHNTPPRSTLCFTVSVAQSEMLSEIFNRVVPNIAGWVCGATKEEERHATNERFKSGDLPILCNCGTHTRGVDVPRAEVIVPKPTKSHALAIQMYGRGLRPPEVGGNSIVDQYPTAAQRKLAIATSRKPCCTILDLYGITGKHKMVTPANILGGDYSEEVMEKAIENARAKMQPVNMTEEMMAAQEQLLKEQEIARQKAAARKARLVGKARFTVGSANLFDGGDVAPMKAMTRTGRELSEKQRAILVNKLGKDPDKIPIGYAKKIIGDYFGRFKK